METYDHIELTEAEKSEALRLARKVKDQRIRSEAYIEKVKRDPVYPVLSYQDLSGYLKRYYKESGKELVIDQDNEIVIEQLLLYFSGSERFETEYGMSLKKGIMLIGPVGCGKTTLMKALSYNSFNPFVVRRCEDLTGEYQKYGHDVIVANIQPVIDYPQRNFGHDLIGSCFDDLGTEDISKNFGNSANVMASIIHGRYDDSKLKGKTHFTANLTTEDIEAFYGSRVRSRLREMCNVIPFSPKSKDRRI